MQIAVLQSAAECGNFGVHHVKHGISESVSCAQSLEKAWSTDFV